jgi:hypothetical protein
MQPLNNAIWLLLGCGLYQRDFEEWDQKLPANKMWIMLKPFIQEAYQRPLNAMSNTAGQNGYMQNAYVALAEDSDHYGVDVQTVITKMAALTAQSQLMAATMAATLSTVAMAIQQLSANQQAMMHQMATLATAMHNPPAPPTHAPFNVPPITQFSVPAIGAMQTGGVWRQDCNRTPRGWQGHGGHGPHTPFANYIARQAGSGISITIPGGIPPPAGRGGGSARGALHSNIVKQFSNMNACFSWGFDVEDRHMSKTCPREWQRPNHQEGYNQPNSQAYIAAGYDACTKAMNKSQYPNF